MKAVFRGLPLDTPCANSARWSPSAPTARACSTKSWHVFFEWVRHCAEWARLIGDEHFSVDGPLVEAWGSQKSFKRKDDDQTPRAWARCRTQSVLGDRGGRQGL